MVIFSLSGCRTGRRRKLLCAMFEPIYHPETICMDGIWDADQFGQVISDQNIPAVAGRVGQMTAGRAGGRDGDTLPQSHAYAGISGKGYLNNFRRRPGFKYQNMTANGCIPGAGL
jgi:hypothetical protein